MNDSGKVKLGGLAKNEEFMPGFFLLIFKNKVTAIYLQLLL